MAKKYGLKNPYGSKNKWIVHMNQEWTNYKNKWTKNYCKYQCREEKNL